MERLQELATHKVTIGVLCFAAGFGIARAMYKHTEPKQLETANPVAAANPAPAAAPQAV